MCWETWGYSDQWVGDTFQRATSQVLISQIATSQVAISQMATSQALFSQRLG